MPDKSKKLSKITKTTKKTITKASKVTKKKAITKKAITSPSSAKSTTENKKILPEPQATPSVEIVPPEIANVPSTGKRGFARFMRIGIVLLLAVLVTFEVFYVVKSKVDRQRVLRRLPDIIGVRGLPDRPGNFTGPMYLRKDSLNRLLLVDINLHKIAVWDIATRQSLFDITPTEAQKPTFDPYLVDVDGSGNIAVWDRTNSEVVTFDKTGTLLKRWQVPPTNGLTMDAAGNVYISDAARNVIIQFDATGQQRQTIGKNKLTQPRNLTTDNEDHLYVVDKGAKRVKVFTTAGKFVREWKTTAEVIDIFENEAYMLDLTDNMLKKYTAKGKLDWQAPLPFPVTLAVDKKGIFYMSGNSGIESFIAEK